MAKKEDYIAEQRRRQRELVEFKKAKENGTLEIKSAEKLLPKTKKEKFFNFLYQYKAALIIVPISVLGVILIISSIVNAPKYDYEILVHGTVQAADEDVDKIKEYILSVAEDTNGDGEVQVLVTNTSYNSADGPGAGHGKNQKFNIEVMSNRAKIFIVNKEIFDSYDQLEESLWCDRFALSEFDGKAEKIENTNFGKLEKTEDEYYVCYRIGENYDVPDALLFEKIIKK